MRRLVVCFVMVCMAASAAFGGVPERDISLTLIPPKLVTDKITMNIRSAVWNHGDELKKCDMSIYLDKKMKKSLLHRQTLIVEPNSSSGVNFAWLTAGHVGRHKMILEVKSDSKTLEQSNPFEVIASDAISTKRINGAWVGITHVLESEGVPWNPAIKQMSNEQWRKLVREMHGVGIDIIIIQHVFQNDRLPYPRVLEDYKGRAFYDSKLYSARANITATDPIEAILAEADELDMHVFMGIGNFHWGDYSAMALEWHKRVSKELWDIFGQHRSFYGWYINEVGATLNADLNRQGEIIDHFEKYTPYVRKIAPDKPVMLAANTWGMTTGAPYWPEVMKHIDILSPFAYHRIPARWGGESAEEAIGMYRKWAEEADVQLWADMESFVFNSRHYLKPRGITAMAAELNEFTDFEQIMIFQYPGLLCAPDADPNLGGEEPVKAYLDYVKYLEEGPENYYKKYVQMAGEHVAKGKAVELATEYAPQYNGGGRGALTDGKLAKASPPFVRWQGYEGVDLDALIDLGKTMKIDCLEIGFLQHYQPGIFLPSQVEFELSDDGQTFSEPTAISRDNPKGEKDTCRCIFSRSGIDQKARYLRVRAKNIGTIPAGHSAAGAKAWLFCDEIMVNPEADKEARK